ncbi:hypothetical protein NIES2119_28805 [[Phormidium ambiguum] IAM M-71]|uniref:Uncharacterized protein n=1 Tax=[Phormidium ambiguum] IAM M-71 TaxID=454136 RepID=A0A1U7I5I5_9CYAN|nr:hypothetical protein [Phormidium ambiguum]OKH31475.1 hypothetical protein NIES2119_28805 [Phormidium ambiguum IAM M-71]
MKSIVRKFRQQFSKSFLSNLMVILVCFVLLIVSGHRMPIHSASSDLKIAQQIDLGQPFQDLDVDGYYC